MKKSKVFLAVILAIVLVIICINAPTFSWFTRPQSQSGEEMKLVTNNEYNAYNGKNVTISTSKSSDGGVSYDTVTTDFNGSNLNMYERNYFCTTITNTSGYDQNVSLYASTLSIPTNTTGSLALGVNGPTRNYRDYTELSTSSLRTTGNTMRVYFEKNNSVSGWGGTDFYICWTDDPDTGSEILDSTGSNGHYYKLSWVGDSGHLNYYYADIPTTATHAFFAVADWGTNDNGEPNWGQRSQTLWNLASDGLSSTSSVIYKITDSTNSSGNHLVEAYSSPGACINSYYSTISLATGDTFDASLDAVSNGSGDYLGGQIKYYSGDEDVFEVDINTGEIEGTGAGEAVLYTKVTNTEGYYDTTQVETTVKIVSASNYEFYNVPIVKNILISGDAGSDQNNPENVQKVYWYVINNSNTGTLSYTIDNIYVGT